MPIDEKLFNSLKNGFSYLEEYDKLRGRPTKRVPICITIPLHLKKEIGEKSKGNVSRFVESILEESIHKK